MDNNAKIFVAGHRGLVGSALMRKLNNEGYFNIITKNRTKKYCLMFWKPVIFNYFCIKLSVKYKKTHYEGKI
jgi:nucleoside-diphosphate-sugar epimerase